MKVNTVIAESIGFYHGFKSRSRRDIGWFGKKGEEPERELLYDRYLKGWRIGRDLQGEIHGFRNVAWRQARKLKNKPTPAPAGQLPVLEDGSWLTSAMIYGHADGSLGLDPLPDDFFDDFQEKNSARGDYLLAFSHARVQLAQAGGAFEPETVTRCPGPFGFNEGEQPGGQEGGAQ